MRNSNQTPGDSITHWQGQKMNIFIWFFYFVVSCGKYSNLSSIIIFVWFFGKPIVFIILYKYKNRNRQMIILLYSSWSSRCSSCHSPESGLHHMQCSNPQSIYHSAPRIYDIRDRLKNDHPHQILMYGFCESICYYCD